MERFRSIPLVLPCHCWFICSRPHLMRQWKEGVALHGPSGSSFAEPQDHYLIWSFQIPWWVNSDFSSHSQLSLEVVFFPEIRMPLLLLSSLLDPGTTYCLYLVNTLLCYRICNVRFKWFFVRTSLSIIHTLIPQIFSGNQLQLLFNYKRVKVISTASFLVIARICSVLLCWCI